VKYGAPSDFYTALFCFKFMPDKSIVGICCNGNYAHKCINCC